MLVDDIKVLLNTYGFYRYPAIFNLNFLIKNFRYHPFCLLHEILVTKKHFLIRDEEMTGKSALLFSCICIGCVTTQVSRVCLKIPNWRFDRGHLIKMLISV